jgi:UDP-N-acetylmuramate--alanine ligase
MADEVWLLPLYPARELPMPGVSSSTIEEKMAKAITAIVPKENILAKVAALETSRKTVLVTAGAGDIDTLVQPITEMLKRIEQK